MSEGISKDFTMAEKIKGYGSYQNEKSDSNIVGVKTLEDGFKVEINIIHDLKEFIGFIDTIKTDYTNPVFYRGHENANYLLIPSVFRKGISLENKMIESFYRRFSNEVDKCTSEIEKLVLMQHYGLPTRCLDITESPLVALYFACNSSVNDDSWGEIVLFQDE